MAIRSSSIGSLQQASPPSLSVHAVARKERIELWLYRGGRPLRQQVALPKALVLDAGRHGQDLIEESISALLHEIESRRIAVAPQARSARSP